MHNIYKKKKKKKKPKTLLEEYEITLYNKYSRILGLILYTLLSHIIFKKGFNNLDKKRGLKTRYNTYSYVRESSPEIPKYKK